MWGDYYVGGFINDKIISGILWYHMHLEEYRTLHAFDIWRVESYLNWCICALVDFVDGYKNLNQTLIVYII